MSDQRLTPEEWERMSARAQCASDGHSWAFLRPDGSEVPTSMWCTRPCGVGTFAIVPAEEVRQP